MHSVSMLLMLVMATPSPATRTLEGEWRGDGPRTVFCEGGWGEIRVRGTEDSYVSVTVTLGARDGSVAGTAAMEAGRLRVMEEGEEVRVFFEDSTESRREGEFTGALKDREYSEIWELSVPQSFAVQATLERGTVEIDDVAGGAHVETGVGEVRLDLPAGDVHVELGEGKMSVRLVRSEVGDVTVYSQGKKPELRVAGRPAPLSLQDEAYTFEGDGPSEVQLETFSAEILVHLR